MTVYIISEFLQHPKTAWNGTSKQCFLSTVAGVPLWVSIVAVALTAIIYTSIVGILNFRLFVFFLSDWHVKVFKESENQFSSICLYKSLKQNLISNVY